MPFLDSLRPSALRKMLKKCPVIPNSRIVAPIRWGIEIEVRRALQQDPGPGTGPSDHLCVHQKVRSKVLQ
jgi:hypothetical protein